MSDPDDDFPKIVFYSPFDDAKQYEAEAGGYLSHVTVVERDGHEYSVVFYDCERLAQDLEYEIGTGRMCVADPGMIVLSSVTLENITKAVKRLSQEGYFKGLCPISQGS